MAFADLLAHALTIYEPETTVTDRYGNDVLELIPVQSVRGRVDMTTAGGQGRELLDDRDTRVTYATIFLPANANVSGTSVIQWDGRRFHVHGEPSYIYGATSLHHIELTAREVEG